MTDEYISREKTLELLKSLSSRDYRRKKGTIQDAIKMISYAVYTPAADVAEVVRCKDCKHLVNATINANGFLICDISDMEIAPDDFCSRGVTE
jgi:hypothetical protein